MRWREVDLEVDRVVPRLFDGARAEVVRRVEPDRDRVARVVVRPALDAAGERRRVVEAEVLVGMALPLGAPVWEPMVSVTQERCAEDNASNEASLVTPTINTRRAGSGTEFGDSPPRSPQTAPRRAGGPPLPSGYVRPVKVVDRTVAALDRVQRRSRRIGFVYGVIKKFGDDNGGMLAGLIAYYGFLSLFPLLLLVITIVGLVTGGSASATHRVEHSFLSQFPVIGSQLGNNVHALHRRAGVGLVVGIVGLLWGSQGAVQAAQYAMAEVWHVPRVDRPGFLQRLGRTMAVLGVAGVFLLLSTALAGVVTVGSRGWLAVVGATVVSLGLNIGIYLATFRLLTPLSVQWRWLLPGAVFGGVGWTVLQYIGGALVEHSLRNTSQVYGFFAIVLGLLAWIYLGAQLTIYAAEVNVVRHRRLWPRSLHEPLTEADREVLRSRALEQRSHPRERVSAGFVPKDQSSPEPDPAEEISDGADGRHGVPSRG